MAWRRAGASSSSARWALLVPISVTCLTFLALPHTVIDDAFIAFRYAVNFGHGHGLVFNPGQHVEGFTDLTWVLLLAAGVTTHVSLPYLAVYGALLCGLATEALLWSLLVRSGTSAWSATAAVTALGLFTPFWLASTSGLEGGLTALLVTALVMTADRDRFWVGALGAALFATRPELVAAPVVLLLIRRMSGNSIRRTTVGLAIGIAAIEALRVVYFGAVLPNTMIAKQPPHDAATLLRNAASGDRYVLGYLLVGIVAAVAFAAALPRLRASYRPWVAVPVVFGWEAVATAVNGGDWMPDHRLLQPITPLLFAGVAVCLDAAARSGARRLALGGSAAVILSWLAVVDFGSLGAPTAAIHAEFPAYLRFAASVPSGVTVAPEAVGELCWADPAVRCHDFLGLTDRTVAHEGTLYQPTLGRIDPSYTALGVRPDIYVAHSGPGVLRTFDVGGYLGHNYRIWYLPPLGLTIAVKDGVNGVNLNRWHATLESLPTS